MPDIQSAVQQAKQAGYSDEEILGYLSKSRTDLAPKIQIAQKSGYAAGEIVSHLGSLGGAKPAQAQPQQDAFEKAVNYHTGNSLIDAPLGLLQGAAKGAASTGVGIGAIARKVAGLPPLPADTFKADTEANGIGQGTGKFLEQSAEFAIPGGAVGKAAKGLGTVGRIIAQGATAGAVGAVQSGGDPIATGTSALLGGAGEAAGPALQKAKQLLGNRAPTLQNFAESFGNATPTQKARIGSALDTLKRDGIKPGADVHEMQDAIKGKLNDLGQAYQSLDPAIKAREMPVTDVVQKLQDAQQAYTKRGVVTDKAGYSALQDQIDTIQQIAKANGGKVQLDDLLHMKQLANGRTNFQSPDADKSLWNKVGNAYRSAADSLAPETTPLNKDYAKYKDLEQIVDQNIARGKGTTKSGLDALGEHVSARHVGAGIGAMFGGAPGAVIGSMAGPKVAKAAGQILQNAIDNGAFAGLSKSGQRLAVAAAKVGDMKTLNRLLGGAAQETAREGATQTQ